MFFDGYYLTVCYFCSCANRRSYFVVFFLFDVFKLLRVGSELVYHRLPWREPDAPYLIEVLYDDDDMVNVSNRLLVFCMCWDTSIIFVAVSLFCFLSISIAVSVMLNTKD